MTGVPLVTILILLEMAGCACLQRDRVDANVVAARQLSLRGMDAIQHCRWDDAESLFANALRKNPSDERAHRHFAELLWRRGEHRDAIRHQEESARLSGGDPEVLVQLGDMYLQQGNAAAAWECAEEAIETNALLPAGWALCGDVHRHRGEYGKALESYHRALNTQPHYPRVQIAVAHLYRKADQPRRALSTLESLLRQYPPELVPQEVEIERGLALKALGRYQDAVEALTVATQRAEPSADLLYELSEAQFQAGNFANARLALQAVLQASPDHPPALRLKDRLDRQSEAMTAALGWD